MRGGINVNFLGGSMGDGMVGLTIKRITCRRWSDESEELWVIFYYRKPICQAQTQQRAIDIALDTFPDFQRDEIQVIE